MTALDWLRNNATVFDIEVFEVEELGCKVEATRMSFRGRVQAGMVKNLQKETKAGGLINIEDEVSENLILNGPNRSDFGKVEFFRTTYKKV